MLTGGSSGGLGRQGSLDPQTALTVSVSTGNSAHAVIWSEVGALTETLGLLAHPLPPLMRLTLISVSLGTRDLILGYYTRGQLV